MSNSAFGAPGVFGGPSMFGAHELDPMFAASNPAPAAVMQAASNPRVIRAVSRGKGKVKQVKKGLIEKSLAAWQTGDLNAARIHLASYSNQKSSTKNGAKRKAKKLTTGTDRKFIDWIDRNWGKVSKSKTVTRKIAGVSVTRKRLGRTSKFPVGYKGPRKSAKSSGKRVRRISAKSLLSPPQALRRLKLKSKLGRKKATARLSGPRLALFAALPAKKRKAKMSVVARPMHRFRLRRKKGVLRYPVQPAVQAIARLPRPEYRKRRQEILVDRTVEAVMERLMADPAFAELPYEAKVSAALPLAAAANAEIEAVESAESIQPATGAEAVAELQQMELDMAAELDAAGDYADEGDEYYEDDGYYEEDEFAGVFGAADVDLQPANSVEAAAKHAVEAVEADAEVAEAEIEIEAEESSATLKKVALASVGLAAFYLFAKRQGYIR